ncbi:hypothetical protein QMK38_07060 [Lysinibacillus fusiformis]|nr:hypothetical protein [Lysinibacillus fusiformis]
MGKKHDGDFLDLDHLGGVEGWEFLLKSTCEGVANKWMVSGYLLDRGRFGENKGIFSGYLKKILLLSCFSDR